MRMPWRENAMLVLAVIEKWSESEMIGSLDRSCVVASACRPPAADDPLTRFDMQGCARALSL
jgi:hypothetical protein